MVKCILKLSVIGFVTLFLYACATLNESECLVADWYIIGLEDGSAGRLQSYLGNHRKACATHGVAPDLINYQYGHSEGLLSFCTRERGFDLGNAGKSYNGVCPDELEHDFIFAYDDGRRLFSARSDVQVIVSRIRYKKKEIERSEREITRAEKAIVSDNTQKDQRIKLLNKTKNLNRYVGQLRRDILSLRRDQVVKEIEYQNILNQL